MVPTSSRFPLLSLLLPCHCCFLALLQILVPPPPPNSSRRLPPLGSQAAEFLAGVVVPELRRLAQGWAGKAAAAAERLAQLEAKAAEVRGRVAVHRRWNELLSPFPVRNRRHEDACGIGSRGRAGGSWL